MEQEETKPEEQPKTSVQEAKEVAERIEKANAEQKRLLEEAKELRVHEVLSGKSHTDKEEEKKPLTEKDYAEGVMRGEILNE